jgi:molybdopterin-binding protein
MLVPPASEMRRVTRPGGTVAATVWDFRGGLVYQRLFWDTAAGIDPKAGDARDRLFSSELALPEGLPNLFREAGVKDLQHGSLTIRMKYASFDDYWPPLFGGQGPVGTYVASLAGDLRLDIEDAVRRAYCSGSPDGERSLTANGVGRAGNRSVNKDAKMKLSARNQFKGKIVDVKKGTTTSHVRIDIGHGVIVTSSITNTAVDELELKNGDEAWAVIKASDVMIGK